MGLLLSLFISLHVPARALTIREVYTVDDWNSIEEYDHVVLMNDLDFKDYNYIPLSQFSGTLDGQGYRLSNISMTSSAEFVGLFGQVNNADIRNLILDIIQIDALHPDAIVGSLAGRIENSKVDEIRVINTNIISPFSVGGLVGHVINSHLNKIQVQGSLAGTMAVGGLIGKIEPLDTFSEVVELNTVSISKSSFQGSISGERQVGGLIGSISTSTNIHINESFSKGTLNAIENAGFMVGEIISSSIEFNDVYSKMDLNYTYDETFFGNFGWIGARMGDGSGTNAVILNHAYQQSSMQGLNAYENMHAWVGWDLDETNPILMDVHYDRETLLVDDVGLKTSEELLIKETYAHFDFDTIWIMDSNLNDGHPLFQYEVFEVTIHPNNGNEIQVTNHTKNSSIILPELINFGYTLEGWYQDDALKIPFDSTKTYSHDIVLYAKWSENPADEVVIEEPTIQEPTIQEPSPVAPNPVQEVETNNVQSPVIVVNKPVVVTPVIEESSETDDVSSASEIITEPKDEEIDTPLDPVENKVSKAGSWCWLWLLIILLLIVYTIYRKLKKRELVEHE